MNYWTLSCSALFSLLVTSNAFAHAWHKYGVIEGFIHPFLGFDHLLAALAVGLLIAHKYKVKFWLPITFISGMVIGCLLGLINLSFFNAELGILFSLVLMGCFHFIPFTLSMKIAIPCMLIFGFFHGNAHGLELIGTSSSSLTLVGLVLSTALLQSIGFMFILYLKKYLENNVINNLLRFSGICMAGVAILFFSNFYD